MQLTNLKKKELSAADYFRKMKNLAHTLSTISMPLRDDEIISYILAGLGPDYDSLVTTIATNTSDITLDEVYAHLMSYELVLERNKSEAQLNFNRLANCSCLFC